MGKFERKCDYLENYLAWKISNHRYLKWSICLLLICLPITCSVVFRLGTPKHVEGHRFLSLSPLRDGWWGFWLPSFSLYWTGGHTERLETPLLAFKQVLIISEVLRSKFVSRVCKYKFRIRPQRVLLEVLAQVELLSAYIRATERWTWLAEVSLQSAR